MLGLVVVVIALVWAMYKGGKALKASYQRRMGHWESEHPDASRIHHHAATIGQALTTLWRGGPVVWHGWKEGWKHGKALGDEWAAKHKPVKPEPEIKSEPVAPVVGIRPDGKADLRVAPQPQPAPRRGSQDMAIKTANGGEFATPEQLMAELNAKVEEHAADLEDAKADLARATEELQRTTRMGASMKKLKLPENDINQVLRLVDPAKAKVEAAELRVRSADASLAGAKAAQAMAAKHMQMMGQAAGSFYGNR